MPGLVVHLGALVHCGHGGQAQPTAPDLRVTVGGQPVATLPAPWVISGCTMLPPPAGNGPCLSASWLAGSRRVFASGSPLALAPGPAVCAPTGSPLLVVDTQARVSAR